MSADDRLTTRDSLCTSEDLTTAFALGDCVVTAALL
jgi:hypothetical protein